MVVRAKTQSQQPKSTVKNPNQLTPKKAKQNETNPSVAKHAKMFDLQNVYHMKYFSYDHTCQRPEKEKKGNTISTFFETKHFFNAGLHQQTCRFWKNQNGLQILEEQLSLLNFSMVANSGDPRESLFFLSWSPKVFFVIKY